jgi:hypothetical protein
MILIHGKSIFREKGKDSTYSDTENYEEKR